MTAAPKRRRSGPSGPSVPPHQRDGVRVDLVLPTDLAEAVDELRGDEHRTAWIRGAVEARVRARRG